jgi:methyltransferase-like protein/2-polyprenyl-3-methyl-5-hydroxy-6-metoxy-1,4-benzoquinol methylase
MTAYDQTRYPSYTHAQTHPDQLAVKATLFGLSPAPVEKCRVLELGCGDGTNLASMALGLPQSQFVGIDLAASPIHHGQEMARALGLKNLTLNAGSVLDIGADYGEFDYIIAHGLYSWVPAEVREKILVICKTNLAPQGVAYVSYNANPGGHFKSMIREMMLFHTKTFADPKERVHQAIALMKFLAESQTKVEPYRQFLQEELALLLERDENNIFHDELGECNVSFSFHQFSEDAKAHGLQYLAEADYVQMQDSNFGPQVRDSLRQLGKNRIAREQYLDFLSFRRFRQTLLCHADLPLRFGMQPDKLGRFHIACAAHPVSAEPSLEPDVLERFVGDKEANLELTLPLAKSALWTLAKAWPRALPFTELLAQARARLGREADASIDREALALFEIFLQTYAPGLTTLYFHPPKFSSEAGEHPLASPLARWQAPTSDRIANLCHAPVVLENASGRHLLTLLDGTRDRAALLREMRPFIDADRKAQQLDKDQTPAVLSDNELARNLESTLEVFARYALLMG